MPVCDICEKHRNMNGLLIKESDGLILSHMPAPADGSGAYLGYCFIEAKKHITDFSDLESSDAVLIGNWLQALEKSHREILKASKTYFFKFADITPHFHIHVYPRHPGTPDQLIGEAVRHWTEAPRASLEDIRYFVNRVRAFL
jgi:diadenosine tetraphosphate (Ap4A) HIT family hydrolase